MFEKCISEKIVCIARGKSGDCGQPPRGWKKELFLCFFSKKYFFICFRGRSVEKCTVRGLTRHQGWSAYKAPQANFFAWKVVVARQNSQIHVNFKNFKKIISDNAQIRGVFQFGEIRGVFWGVATLEPGRTVKIASPFEQGRTLKIASSFDRARTVPGPNWLIKTFFHHISTKNLQPTILNR